MIINDVKKYRLEKSFTQQELADLVDVRRETIGRLEKQLYNPSLELALRISEVLDQDVNRIFQLQKKVSDCKW